MTNKVFDSRGRLVDVNPEPRDPASAGRAVRVIYLAALMSMAVPAPTSGWVRLAFGSGGLWKSPMALVAVAMFALIVWRIVVVVRDRSLLDAPIERGFLRGCRTIAVVLMATGVAIYVLQWFVFPIGRAMFPRGSDNGIEFFVVGMWLAMFATAIPLGLLMFEASRLMGFERWYRARAASSSHTNSTDDAHAGGLP